MAGIGIRDSRRAPLSIASRTADLSPQVYELKLRMCQLCRALNSLPETQGRRIEAHFKMHDEVIQVGGILRAARGAKGMTQAALAKATGTVERTIMDLENDKRHPSLEVLYKIINALDFSADHIFRPEKVPCTLEQEQLLREIQSCNERDQAVVIEAAQACVRALQREKGAKKADGD